MSTANESLRSGQMSQPVDIDRIGYWAATVGGAALTVYGLSRRSVPGLILATLGGSLLYRCSQETCCATRGDRSYQFFADRPADPDIEHSPVDEASWESFPASDPPAAKQITS